MGSTVVENNLFQKKSKYLGLLFISIIATIGMVGVVANPQLREKIPFLPSTSKYIDLAYRYMADNNYKAALNEINKAIKFDSKNSQLYIERANILNKIGDDKGKLQDYKQAIQLVPENKDIYLQSLVNSYGYGTKEQLTAYTKAIEIDPNNAGLYIERGMLRNYYDVRERADALKDFNTAIELEPKNIKAYKGRAGVFTSYLFNVKKEDMQLALKDYTKIIELDPNNIDAYRNRANVREELGDKQGALEDYNQMIQINNLDDYDRVLGYEKRADFKNKLGDKQGALQDYNSAIQINPTSISLFRRRAEIRYETGNNQGALEDLNEIYKLSPPRNADDYFNRGLNRAKYGDKKGGLQDLNTAIQLNFKDTMIYKARADIRRDLKDNQGTLEDYNMAIKLDPRFASAYNNRGVLKYDLDDKKGALQDYTTAIQLFPSAVSYNNRASLRSELDDKKGAILDYQEAARLYKKQGNSKKYSEMLDAIKYVQILLPK